MQAICFWQTVQVASMPHICWLLIFAFKINRLLQQLQQLRYSHLMPWQLLMWLVCRKWICYNVIVSQALKIGKRRVYKGGDGLNQGSDRSRHELI